MAAETSSGRRFFPAVCIELRTATRSSQIVLSPSVQASALVLAVAVTAVLANLGISQIGYVRFVSDEELAISRAENANVDLQDDVARLRDKLAVTVRDRAAAKEQLSAVANQADAVRGQLELTEMKLLALEQRASNREVPQAQERTSEIGTVEPMLSEPTTSEAYPAQSAVSTPDSATKTKHSAESVAELGRRAIGEFKRVLASAGVDVARLFSHFGVNRAEGGPFVPPPRADQPAGTVGTNGLVALRDLAKSLPLSVPLDRYQIGSRFGPRRDPFNGKPAFHSGLDFDAGYMSPVYATAPGIVTYAGYRGAYGKVVEIDHGNGISTLYGHMHRYIVSVGQRVEAQTKIGLLGSTGRASGPHVHYEVIVNGQPQDPEKFIGLARFLPIAER
jgi:murein DD-endopeptidase MepM/ murein hydrolase activator NlpD